jgi:hypothetical protein
MMRSKLNEHLYNQLPAYVNGTLGPLQRKVVEQWLARNDQARATAETLQNLQTAVRRQPRRTPPPAVLGRVQAEIDSRRHAPAGRQTLAHPHLRPSLGFPILVLSLVTIILAAAVMWQALPPGIVLKWSVEGNAPEAFRVYRAEIESGEVAAAQFELLEEMPATAQDRSYTFTDFRLLPGQNYVYRVEGLNESGQPAASQTIIGQAEDALPGQLAVLLVLIFTAYCFWNIMQLRRPDQKPPFTPTPA